MEQRELAGARLVRDVHRVLDRAVTPVALVRELGLGVLRVVDEEVGAVGELEHFVGHEVVALDRTTAAARLPVVGDVRDGDATDIDPVPEGGSDVTYPPRTHLGRPDREVVVAGVVEPHRALEAVGRDREVRRTHHAREDLPERAFRLAGTVDVEHGGGAEERSEERESLDVVPVEVGQQHRRVEALVAARSDQLGAVVAESGTEVEHDGVVAVGLDHHAGGVPPVPGETRPVAWGRPPDTEEADSSAPRHSAWRIPSSEGARNSDTGEEAEAADALHRTGTGERSSRRSGFDHQDSTRFLKLRIPTQVKRAENPIITG